MSGIKKLKAVVFDMDGVIFDSERAVTECWKVIAEKYNIPNIHEACVECMGTTRDATREIMFRRYGNDFPYGEYKKEVSDLFMEKYGEGRLPKKPGVEELLSFLKEKNIKIALASSTRKAVVEKELTDAKLIHYFDKVICGDMVQRSKPEPDIFMKACDELGVKYDEGIAIEDSYNGIKSASRAKMHPIMVPDMAPVTDEMEQLADEIFKSLYEVKEYIQNLI